MNEAGVDYALAEIAESGWLVNNLFQHDDGTWQANLRKPEGDGSRFTAFAKGTEAVDALYTALNVMATLECEWTENPPPSTGEAEPKAAKPAKDRTPSLAHTLGLIKPFNRRL